MRMKYVKRDFIFSAMRKMRMLLTGKTLNIAFKMLMKKV